MTLAIHSPDELIAALPHLLGFKPEESLIFVPLRPDLPLARVDIPTTAREREGVWNSIGSALSRHAQLGARTAIVCITPDRAHAEQVGQEFASRLAAIGIDAPLRLWADDTSWCDFTTGQSGLQTGAARDQVAAATVLDGRPRPAPSRAAIASSLVGDRQPIEALLPKARANAAMGSARREGEWAQGRVEEFHRDGVRLSDADAARLLIGVDIIPTRDSLWNTITRDTTTSHIALWRDLTRRAPDEVRAAPASLLAFTAWLNGDGALAWCAIDQVPQDKPYALANLVAATLEGGMHPREWETAQRAAADRGMNRGSEISSARRTAPHGGARETHGF